MKNSYYNTTGQKGDTLFDYEQKAKTQEEIILKIFNQSSPLGPSELQRLVYPRVPLTSIRRALTNLTKKGKLQKTPSKKIGNYGREEHLWAIA